MLCFSSPTQSAQVSNALSLGSDTMKDLDVSWRSAPARQYTNISAMILPPFHLSMNWNTKGSPSCGNIPHICCLHHILCSNWPICLVWNLATLMWPLYLWYPAQWYWSYLSIFCENDMRLPSAALWQQLGSCSDLGSFLSLSWKSEASPNPDPLAP